MARAKPIPSLEPSKLLIQSIDQISASSSGLILDAPCGFGRNAFELARRGFDVVAVDKDISRLRSVQVAQRHSPTMARLSLIATDLTSGRLPFAKATFSLILCVHYPVQCIVHDLSAVLKEGGCLYIETFQGHGQNYLELPKPGELREALSGFELIFYRERPTGPKPDEAVIVEALARKRSQAVTG